MTSDVSFSTPFTGREISPQTPKRKRIEKDKFHSPVGSPYFSPNRRIVQVSETDNLSVDPLPSRIEFSSISKFQNSPTRNALTVEASVTADLMERLSKLKPLLIQGTSICRSDNASPFIHFLREIRKSCGQSLEGPHCSDTSQ
jgi:hypothetical protein